MFPRFASTSAFTLMIIGMSFVWSPVRAATLADAVRGFILLDVEQSGEAWYVYPVTDERYYLGRPDDAFAIMRSLSLGITDADLAGVPTEDETEIGDLALRERLAGRILLQVEQNGEAWYVHPTTLRRSYLGRPVDAFAIMTEFGLGISSANLTQIPIADLSLELPTDETFTSHAYTLTIEQGSFPLHVVTLDRDAYRMVTDTAEPTDCASDCAALSLQAYITENGAFAGMHGTYFCPPGYVGCENQINTFLPPVYNTALDEMHNTDSLPLHDRPLIAEDADGELYYFHRTDEFGDTTEEFEEEFNTELQAAIGNWPSLVENGIVVVESEPSESAFLVSGTRGAIGWNNDTIYLVIAESASVPEMAYIMDALGALYAMNLDGGGSAALYVNGGYVYGPGRLLPNAIVFQKR